eukprot:ANDGO_00710.mRNA.1 hypothetical protein
MRMHIFSSSHESCIRGAHGYVVLAIRYALSIPHEPLLDSCMALLEPDWIPFHLYYPEWTRHFLLSLVHNARCLLFRSLSQKTESLQALKLALTIERKSFIWSPWSYLNLSSFQADLKKKLHVIHVALCISLYSVYSRTTETPLEMPPPWTMSRRDLITSISELEGLSGLFEDSISVLEEVDERRQFAELASTLCLEYVLCARCFYGLKQRCLGDRYLEKSRVISLMFGIEETPLNADDVLFDLFLIDGRFEVCGAALRASPRGMKQFLELRHITPGYFKKEERGSEESDAMREVLGGKSQHRELKALLMMVKGGDVAEKPSSWLSPVRKVFSTSLSDISLFLELDDTLFAASDSKKLSKPKLPKRDSILSPLSSRLQTIAFHKKEENREKSKRNRLRSSDTSAADPCRSPMFFNDLAETLSGVRRFGYSRLHADVLVPALVRDIQRLARGYSCRKALRARMRAVRLIQFFFRFFVFARRRTLRRDRAAGLIGAGWRRSRQQRSENPVSLLRYLRSWIQYFLVRTRLQKMLCAASLINRWVVSHVRRRQFLLFVNSCRKIQATFRAWILRRQFRQIIIACRRIEDFWGAVRDCNATRRRSCCATKISAAFKGFRIRKLLHRIDICVRKVQMLVRRRLCYKRLLLRSSSACAIQKWLCHVSSSCCHKGPVNCLLLPDPIDHHAPATKIQNAWRRYRYRQSLSIVGAFFHDAKIRLSCMHREQWENAIRVIQAAWRSAVVRRKLFDKARAAIFIQKSWRCYVGRREFLQDRHRFVVIQRRFRRRRCGHVLATRSPSTAVNPFPSPCVPPSCGCTAATTAAAAFKIFYCWKSYVVRRTIAVQNSAAKRLQTWMLRSVIRNNLLHLHRVLFCLWTRHKFLLKVKCALRIQSFYRRWIARKRYAQIRNGFRLLQNVWRSKLERATCCRSTLSFARFCVCFSVIQARYRFARLRRRCIMLQKWYRRILATRSVLRAIRKKSNSTLVVWAFYCSRKIEKMRGGDHRGQLSDSCDHLHHGTSLPNCSASDDVLCAVQEVTTGVADDALWQSAASRIQKCYRARKRQPAAISASTAGFLDSESSIRASAEDSAVRNLSVRKLQKVARRWLKRREDFELPFSVVEESCDSVSERGIHVRAISDVEDGILVSREQPLDHENRTSPSEHLVAANDDNVVVHHASEDRQYFTSTSSLLSAEALPNSSEIDADTDDAGLDCHEDGDASISLAISMTTSRNSLAVGEEDVEHGLHSEIEMQLALPTREAPPVRVIAESPSSLPSSAGTSIVMAATVLSIFPDIDGNSPSCRLSSRASSRAYSRPASRAASTPSHLFYVPSLSNAEYIENDREATEDSASYSRYDLLTCELGPLHFLRFGSDDEVDGDVFVPADVKLDHVSPNRGAVSPEVLNDVLGIHFSSPSKFKDSEEVQNCS